jgi:hypothetical protein
MYRAFLKDAAVLGDIKCAPVMEDFSLKNTHCSLVYAILITTVASWRCHQGQHIRPRLLNSNTGYSVFAM